MNLIRNTFIRTALVMSALSISTMSYAAGCVENVTNLIVHWNGGIYFQTSQTCAQGWCQITFATTDANKHAYAMLLSAKMNSIPLLFAWPNLSSCSAQNATYASPEFIVLQ
jgi:hypothetical protein